MTLVAWLLPWLAGIAAAGITWRMRLFAVRRSILDRPNARSNHTIPTPRGGGVGIVVSILGTVLIATALGYIGVRLAAALTGGGLLVAAIGWNDDVRGSSVRVRLAIHVLAASWAIWWLGAVTELRVGDWVVSMPRLGVVLTGLALVWSINLFNFMDGLDGFAGTQALTTSLAAALLLAAAGALPLALLALIVAGASAGFLLWNWHPARIFMGDVGSYFLGYCFAVIALAGDRTGAVPVILWVIVFGAFLFDATATVVRRLLRGAAVYAAHREHAYQRAVLRVGGHQRVALSLATLNVVLAAIAWWGLRTRTAQPLAVLLALGVLTAVYLLVEFVSRPAPAGRSVAN